METMAQALLNANLPPPEVFKFDGDAKKWASFITSFQAQIGSKVIDPASKLSYLIQYCTGEAKSIIQQCVLLPPEIGYERAIQHLTQRFGSKHMVAGSYIQDLKTGPKVPPNNVEALLKFADQLDTTYIVLSQLEYISDVNSTDTLAQCVKRLPYHLINDWVKQAAKITLNQLREPQFLDFVKFVQANAAVANTYFGREAAKSSQAQWKQQQQSGTRQEYRGNRQQQAQDRPRQTTMTVQGTAGDQFSFASFEQEYQSFGNSLLNLTPAQVVKAYNDWVAKQRERMARQDSSQRGRQFKSPQEEIQDCNEALARERARFHSQRRGGDPYSAASQRFMGDPYSYESQVQGSGKDFAPTRAPSQVRQGSAPPSRASSSGYGGSINTDKACPNCSVDTHKFENCRKFKALPIQERLDFVQRARLF